MQSGNFYGQFLSSTEASTNVIIRSVKKSFSGIYYLGSSKTSGNSVRCIKD